MATAPSGPAPKSAAQKRLTDILAWEVSPVDKPANRRPFLLLKNEPAAAPAAPVAAAADGPAPAGTAPPAAPVTKTFPALSPAVRQSVIDAAAAGAEKLAALASAVGEAQVEEGAPTPPELLKLLEESTSDLRTVVEKLAPAAQPAAPVAAAAEPTTPAAAPAAAPTTTGDLLKALADMKGSLEKSIEDRFSKLEKSQTDVAAKVTTELGVMRSKVAATDARLAIGKAAGTGNAGGSDGAIPTPPAPVVWPSDLGAVARADGKP